MNSNLKKLGFALSNQGLEDSITAQIKEQNPSWSDKKVEQELRKIQKEMTIFNDLNKKVKKSKKVK